MKNDIVFILSVPRSYTSLIAAMLGQHPMMYGLPELNLFMAEDLEEFWTGKGYDDVKPDFTWPAMRHGLLRTIAQLYSGEQTIESIAMAYRWIATRNKMSTADVYRTICRKLQPLIPLDKSPGYVGRSNYLQRIKKTFPNARYIHLIRHPIGQCQSFLNVNAGKLVLFLSGCVEMTDCGMIIDPQIVWYNRNIRILDFLQGIPEDRQLRIIAEDFLDDLPAGFAGVFYWLGLPLNKYAMDEIKHPENSHYAYVGPVNARLGNDINFLQNPKFRSSNIKRYKLNDPLPWRPDNKPFKPEVLELAQEFSYS